MGSVVAAAAPALVVHAEADELVPISDCRQYCTRNAASGGGLVCRFIELPPTDADGASIDHSLFHWAKPAAAVSCGMEQVMREWFLLP